MENFEKKFIVEDQDGNVIAEFKSKAAAEDYAQTLIRNGLDGVRIVEED